MPRQNDEIKIKVEQKLRSSGKKNIRIGLTLIFIAGITALIILFSTSIGWQFITKLFFPGLIFLAIGGRQYYLINYKDRREMSKHMYGVEEPEKYWSCPKCQNENPNTTYDCQSCGYSLE